MFVLTAMSISGRFLARFLATIQLASSDLVRKGNIDATPTEVRQQTGTYPL